MVVSNWITIILYGFIVHPCWTGLFLLFSTFMLSVIYMIDFNDISYILKKLTVSILYEASSINYTVAQWKGISCNNSLKIYLLKEYIKWLIWTVLNKTKLNIAT